jgi:hypothetical protein
MSRMGHAPGTYDDAEIWEVASALGANEVDEDAAPAVVAQADPMQFLPPGVNPADFRRS